MRALRNFEPMERSKIGVLPTRGSPLSVGEAAVPDRPRLGVDVDVAALKREMRASHRGV